MYLLLGDPHDPCCLLVQSALNERDLQSHIVPQPLLDPARFAWRLSNDVCESTISWGGEQPLRATEIAGVFVRHSAALDPTGWLPHDLAYIQAELHAALLAWLWSLPCPVINRYPAAIWYRPRAPLIVWQPLLRRCGLPVVETLLTNIEHEARAFGRDSVFEGAPSAVYAPLTGEVGYLVAEEHEWRSLGAVLHSAPAALTRPHGAARLVCVVGEQLIWAEHRPPDAALLEPGLVRFAAAAGLNFVELTVAPLDGVSHVTGVEPFPRLEGFDDAARRQVGVALADLLTGSAVREPMPTSALEQGARL